MKKIVLVFTMVMILCCLFTIYSFADITFGDMVDHWASESVSVLAEKGIVAGWDGLFHPNDKVRINEYIKMVIVALGYTDIQNYQGDWSKNYIDKALELGLVFPNEVLDYNEYINRGMMAKIIIRALDNEETPDYIMAYKGLLTDYFDLEPDIRQEVLMCLEKGLIKGMPDGSFKPLSYSTRAEAATVIHRMISVEERDKAKPIFATPDLEFEKFMASEEAEQVCSVENILKVVEGKVIFGSEYSGYQVNSGDRLVYNYHIKEANKQVYEVLRDLIMYAKENGHFVRTFLSTDSNVVTVMYYEEPKYGQGPNWYTTFNFDVTVCVEPYKYDIEKGQEEYTYFYWHINNLVKQTTDDWSAVNYRDIDMTKALQIAMYRIYEEDLGQRMFDFVVSRYDESRDQWFRQGNRDYVGYYKGYNEDLDGLEIYYKDGLLSTNK